MKILLKNNTCFTITIAALFSSTVKKFKVLKRNAFYATLSTYISVEEPLNPYATFGFSGRQYVLFKHCCNSHPRKWKIVVMNSLGNRPEFTINSSSNYQRKV